MNDDALLRQAEILKDPFVQFIFAAVKGDLAAMDDLVAKGLDLHTDPHTVTIFLAIITNDGLSYNHDFFDKALSIAKRYNLSYDFLSAWYEQKMAAYAERNEEIASAAPGLKLCGEFLAYRKAKAHLQ